MWFWLVLVSGFSSSLQQIIHRFVLREERDALVYALLFQLTTALVVVPLLVFNFRLPPFGLPYLGILASSILSGSYLLITMRAYNYAEASMSAVAAQTKAIWSWLLGVLLLGEGAGLTKFLGVILIFAGVTMTTMKGQLRLNKGICLILLAAVVGSVETVFDKYSLKFFPVPVFVFIVSLAPALMMLPTVKTPKVRFKRFFQGKNRNVFLTGFLAAISYYSVMWAISLGEISKIVPISQAFTVVTIGGGILLLKERGKIWEKIIGGLLAVLGVVLVKLG